jgi:hypothetical protein
MPLQEVGSVPEVFAALHLVQHTSSIEPVPMITLLDGEPAELQAQVRGERSGVFEGEDRFRVYAEERVAERSRRRVQKKEALSEGGVEHFRVPRWRAGDRTREGRAWEGLSGEEYVMDARVEEEAITTRIEAVALTLAIIVYVVSTAIHPSGEVMNNPVIFRVYAQDDSWIAVHFGQWLGVMLLFGGFVALYYSITTNSASGAGVVARFGLAAAVLTAASLTMLQAVDGVALKWAVDEWASAPADQESATFAAAKALRWSEYGLQSYSNILLGLTLILYGLAMALGTAYPRWLGWVAAGSGVAWIVHGLMVPYIGLFHSIPRGIALVLMSLWAFIMASLMWRNCSRGRIARPEESAPK